MRGVERLLIWLLMALTMTVFAVQVGKWRKNNCALRAYTVIRWNPNHTDFMLKTLMMDGLEGGNPKFLVTEVLACSYEHVEDKTVFYGPHGLKDTMNEVIHVQDKGVAR
jgi:hypothetical protein